MKKVLLLTMALVIASCSKQDDNTTEILNISQEKVLSDDEIFELFDFDAKGTTVSTSKHGGDHELPDNWIEWLFTDEGRIIISEAEGDVLSLTNTKRSRTVSITERHRVGWDGSKLIYDNGDEVSVSESAKLLYNRVFNINQTLHSKYVKDRSPEYIFGLINRSSNADFEFFTSALFEGIFRIEYRSASCFGSRIILATESEVVTSIKWLTADGGNTEYYNNGFDIDQIVLGLNFSNCYTEAEAVILSALRTADAGFYLPNSGEPFITSTCSDLTVTINDYTNADAWSVSVQHDDPTRGLVIGNYNSNGYVRIPEQFSCYPGYNNN